MSKKVSKTEKKYEILWERLKEKNPEIDKELHDFFKEIEETWRRVSPFVGEEDAYGVSGLRINDEHKIRGMAFDFILLSVAFKRVFGKLDRELKWFKENKEILEMMVKEYLEAQKLR